MKICILDKNIPLNIIEKLEEKGYKVVPSLSLNKIDGALATHPDIQLCKIDDDTLVVEPSTFIYYKNILSPLGVKVLKGESYVTDKYPNDIPYNIAINGEIAIHNFNYTDKTILDNLDSKRIQVKQGYGKCNVAFAKDAIITSDVGIYGKIKGKKLLIRSGFIELEGFNYGFIGGATGFHEKLYFIGNLNTHPDSESIIGFLKDENIEFESLGSENLKDFGSLIFLKTEEKI